MPNITKQKQFINKYKSDIMQADTASKECTLQDITLLFEKV